LFWALWLAVGLALYQHREALRPLLDLGELAWHRQPAPADGHARLAGHGVRAYSGTGFEFRGTNGVALNCGLAGVSLDPARWSSTPAGRDLLEAARAHLHQRVAGQSVVLELLLSNPEARTGLGVAYVNGTNLNELTLAEGFGVLERERIRSLHLLQQWALLQAERAARVAGRGVWHSSLAGAPAPAP
jgi:endonuclease YncB( thermonuclease family)